MQWFYRLQILLLATLRPTTLFKKINQLEWYKKTLHTWIVSLPLSSKSQLLEVGCATGVLSAYVSTLGHKATGIDGSKNMIDIASKNYSNIDFKVADATRLPFLDAQFDAVLSSSLLNIVDDKQKVLSEMLRVAKNHGTISFLVPLEGFSAENLTKLTTDLNLEGFSKAALHMWHKSAPKMSYNEIQTLADDEDLTIKSTDYYLDNMLISMTIIKDN